MHKKRVLSFSLIGIEIRVVMSFFVLGFIMACYLAVGYLPMVSPGLKVMSYGWMGALGAAGFLASIVLHEIAHVVAARLLGIRLKRITLYLFGGVPEMAEKPPRPYSEFFMGLAGPLASVAVGTAFIKLGALGGDWAWPAAITAGLTFWAWINVALAFLNIAPAYPLDGGRMLRSLLWEWKRDLLWATRISSSIGRGFSVALITFGVVYFIFGNPLGGTWWCLLGIFIYGAAKTAFPYSFVSELLEGESVRTFMRRDSVIVPFSDGIALPTEDWDSAYEEGFSTERHMFEVGPETDLAVAVGVMRSSGKNRLRVVSGGRSIGSVAMKDVRNFLAGKLDLEDVSTVRTFTKPKGPVVQTEYAEALEQPSR